MMERDVNSNDDGVVFWRTEHKIGRAGFGTVFLGYNKEPGSLPKMVAVKSEVLTLTCSLRKERQKLDRFWGCSNIVQCLGSQEEWTSDGYLLYNLFLEYADGGSLRDHIRRRGRYALSIPEVKHYARCMLRGISKIHELGFVHCDLKPENVLLFTYSEGPFTNAKIADFGLSKRSGRKKSRRGTTAYLAPETKKFQIQEPPSDIWSLGLVVFEMITGVHHWGAEYGEAELVLLPKASDDSRPFIPRNLSTEAHNFLNGCFETDPMRRSTAIELLNHPFLAIEEENRTCVDGSSQSAAVKLPSIKDNIICISSSSDSSPSSPSYTTDELINPDRPILYT